MVQPNVCVMCSHTVTVQHCKWFHVVAFDGCLYGPDSQWNITWANTSRNATDTQPCPGGVESRGNKSCTKHNISQGRKASIN